MPKQTPKQKILFKIRVGKRSLTVTKPRLEWAILLLLVLAAGVVQFSGLYPYAYNYAICGERPLEIRDHQYYRVPSDVEYGIHIGSSYDACFGEPSMYALQRDPSTKAAQRIAAKAAAQKAVENARIASISNYTVYTPQGYQISNYEQNDYGDRYQTDFRVTTNSGLVFDVSETKKGSSYDYAKVCDKEQTENWSGTIIGTDNSGNKICKTNSSKYVKQYVASMYKGDTAIMLRNKATAETQFTSEVVAIFDSMQPKT
jgi:hypothetical protein